MEDFKIFAFQNLQFKILADFLILPFQDPEFKILAFQYPEIKILAYFKILALLNPEFEIFADFKISPF